MERLILMERKRNLHISRLLFVGKEETVWEGVWTVKIIAIPGIPNKLKVRDGSEYCRCCSPWQTLSGDKCMMSKSRNKSNLSMSLIPHTPVCEASLLLPGQYSLEGGVVVVGGGKRVRRGGYCLDRGSARVCIQDTENR